MKQFKKIFVLFVAIFCLLTLVACGADEPNVLDSYIFSKEGTTISADFVLPGEIGGYAVTWSSDNNALVLEEIEEGYRAVVHVPETDQEVHLTVKHKKQEEQTYTVRVRALDVYSFLDNYPFVYDKKTVSESFDLDSEYTYKNHTCGITWEVEDDYKDYLEVKNGKCLVSTGGLDAEVKIKATFSYNGETASKSYKMTLIMPQTDEEKMVYWYDNPGIIQTLSGYVVHKGPWTLYSGKYEAILYCIDDTLTFGFYLYNETCSMSEEEYASMPIGAHITCENPQAAIYNGLHETSNYKGYTTWDKDIEPIDITPFAIDNDILGNTPMATYAQSRLVSLTNWKVTSIKAVNLAEKAAKAVTVATIEKNDVAVTLAVGTYTYGQAATDNDTNRAITQKLGTLHVGDWISVKGLLSYYNGPQINLINADDITVGTEDKSTTSDGAKTAAAMAQIKAKLAEYHADDVLPRDVTFSLPEVYAQGGTITYKLMSKSSNVKLSYGTFAVKPTKLERIHVRVEYNINGYKTFEYFYLTSQGLTDEQLVAKTKESCTLSKTTFADPAELSIITSAYGGLVTVTWSCEDDHISIVDDKILVSLPADAAKDSVITATITCGDVTDTKEFNVHCNQLPDYSGQYIIKMYFAATPVTVYATGVEVPEGNYLASTTNPEEAFVFDVVKVPGRPGCYYLMSGDKYVVPYSCYNADDGKYKGRVHLADSDPKYWVWSSTYSTFLYNLVVGTYAAEDYFLGSYSGAEAPTFAATSVYYITGDNAKDLGTKEYVCEFVRYEAPQE